MGVYNFDNPGEQIGPEWLANLNDWFFEKIRTLWGGYYEINSNATSTEFMFSSGQNWLRNAANIEFSNLSELSEYPGYLFFAIIMFCFYPYLLHSGVQLGELLFGSKPGKPGAYRMAWGPLMVISMVIVPIIAAFTVQDTIFPTWAWCILLDVGILILFLGDFFLVQKKKG